MPSRASCPLCRRLRPETPGQPRGGPGHGRTPSGVPPQPSPAIPQAAWRSCPRPRRRPSLPSRGGPAVLCPARRPGPAQPTGPAGLRSASPARAAQLPREPLIGQQDGYTDSDKLVFLREQRNRSSSVYNISKTFFLKRIPSTTAEGLFHPNIAEYQ